MDTNPRILLWGLSDEEKERLSEFMKQLTTATTVVIEPYQGYLLVHEILFSDKRAQEALSPDQKIVLFFNVPAEVIRSVMNETKKMDSPRPICAMVTHDNIAWKFSDLVDHLKKEHEFMQKRLKKRDGRP